MMKRFIPILLSVMLLLMPVLGNAETAPEGYYYFSISNPKLSVPSGETSMDIDLSGLELLFAAEESENGVDLLISALGNGVAAISGRLSMDENGIFAIVDGMENAIGIPMETIEALMSQAVQQSGGSADDNLIGSAKISVIGGADGPTNIIVNGESISAITDIFSEEALAKFASELASFGTAIEMSEPVEDVLLENNVEVPAQRVDYFVSSEALTGLLKAAAELCMSNEEFAEGYRTSIEEQGAEYIELSVFVEQFMQDTGLNVEGSLFTTESGSIFADNYINTISSVDENGQTVYESVNMQCSFTDDENGTMFFAGVYPPESTEALEFVFASAPSAEFEGKEDIAIDLTLYEIEGEAIEVNTQFSFYTGPVADEAYGELTVYNLMVNSEGQLVSIGLSTYGDEAAHGGQVSLVAPDGTAMYIGYDGAANADGNSENGEFWAHVYQGEALLGSFTSNISVGLNTSGESIAYDFASVPVVDITTIDDATAQALEEELLTVVYEGLSVIGAQVPIIGMLLSMTGMSGSLAG